MNTETGEFVDEQRAEAWMKQISVGEVVKIKDEELEVVSIGKREITLKLLSHAERVAKELAFGSVVDFEEFREAESKRQFENMLKRRK